MKRLVRGLCRQVRDLIDVEISRAYMEVVDACVSGQLRKLRGTAPDKSK